MALQQACYVENGKTVGGVIPDASSAIGYKENVGGTCVNPNGYTAGSYFMASNNGYMYKALTNIARGDAFRIGTNCEQTNVSSELNSINADLSSLEWQYLGSLTSSSYEDLGSIADITRVQFIGVCRGHISNTFESPISDLVDWGWTSQSNAGAIYSVSGVGNCFAYISNNHLYAYRGNSSLNVKVYIR
jgi:hypothetical protein